MNRIPLLFLTLLFAAVAPSFRVWAQNVGNEDFARDPKQPLDQDYTQRIKKYTTAPSLNSPLTDYLPASNTVPTPAKVLGDVAGAPDMLPYAEDVYRYFRMLAAASPRIKVITIGHSEEGREMIAAAIADESLMAREKENDARLAKLGDPRLIGMNDKTAADLVAQSFPVYYITGTIHSPETGAPTALMELAYRLIVDNSPYIQFIRTHMVTLITPVVEVDGRDRMVDIYKWHKAHPGENWPRLIYWGHYVAHDNNRDAMGMTLDLTRNVLNNYLAWHAQVLHDLHESVPFLYDNTVGDGPYNAWIDPMLADEWAMLAWRNVQQMQNFGMPGAFTHGNFDTWSPGYLMFLAGLHNGISRLYETFGNGGADTEKRILTPDEYSRTWYRQNPPYPTVVWSQRDNNNYEETALLSTLSYFAHNGKHFLSDYYEKSKRSILKPQDAGPAAYVLPADENVLNRQLQLLKVLAAQHVEIQRLSEAAKVTIEPPAHAPRPSDDKPNAAAKPHEETFAAGSYVIRMDQPFSRVADALLDRQYWSPEDPQKHPYDDTGWSFGDLFDARAVRVTDRSILTKKMELVSDVDQIGGNLAGAGPLYGINNSGEISLAALVYALKGAEISVAEEPFEEGGHKFQAGSLLIGHVENARLKEALAPLDLNAYSVASSPNIHTHAAAAPRIAFMHTWLYTQTEGWWRMAFDKLHVPYDYISTQTAAREAELRSKYDVIIFAPAGQVSPRAIVEGMPMWGNALPWQKTALTPNLGKIDATEDIRPGLGLAGVAHLKAFVEQGGLLITSEDTAQFAIDEGFAPGVFVAPRKNAKVVGSVLNAVMVDKNTPLAYGYGSNLAVYSEEGLAFTVSNLVTPRQILTEKDYKRPTGRGGPEDEDLPEGRPFEQPPALPSPKPWEPTPLNEEQSRNNAYVIPAEYRPNVILRFAEQKNLLLSGLLESGDAIAERPVVVDAHLGKGNVLLFANNPIYRGETIGSYALVFNAILNFDHLKPGRE
ncbi:MAG TPA: M14 family zinc carboxypeptidase [Bryobacteraceae bacterium]|nr:M14 family zinc carboxypeptidase [Bryobacteraceae bacterium]